MEGSNAPATYQMVCSLKAHFVWQGWALHLKLETLLGRKAKDAHHCHIEVDCRQAMSDIASFD